MKKKDKKLKTYHEVKEPQAEYHAFKDMDVNELANKILKAIGDDAQKRATLIGLLVSDVATKQDFATILAELKEMRKASDERFEMMDRRFEAAERRFEAIESELKAMREESQKRFEASEKRFMAIEKRFEMIDKRFEAIDKRFEAIERRFEAIDKRFEAIDKRFEAIDRKFEELRADMDKRFEEQREDFHLSLRLSIEALNKSLTEKISALGSRWGIMAEDTFSVALKEILSKAGFVVTKWRKTDSEAIFFLKPRDAEIDILIKDGKRIAVEVKSTIDTGDIEIFERSVRFYERSESVKVDEKFMVGIHLRKDVEEYASKFGIKLLSHVEEIME